MDNIWSWMTTTIETAAQFNGLEVVLSSVIGFYIFLWILSIIRVSRDIHARTQNTALQLIAILLVTFLSPLLGLPLYITMRPVRYNPIK